MKQDKCRLQDSRMLAMTLTWDWEFDIDPYHGINCIKLKHCQVVNSLFDLSRSVDRTLTGNLTSFLDEGKM